VGSFVYVLWALVRRDEREFSLRTGARGAADIALALKRRSAALSGDKRKKPLRSCDLRGFLV
jgi:hypothetical protein